jgi:hypothetical protein
MDSLARSPFLPANVYNEITLIENQGTPDISNLLGIGEILVRHQLQSQFGVHLLHRHFEIDPDAIVLNHTDDDGTEFSKMTSLSDLGDLRVQPQCFMLDGNQGFIPYEYTYEDATDSPAALPPMLEDELAKYLTQYKLQKLLAIERIKPTSHTPAEERCCWVEFPTDGKATFRRRIDTSLAGGRHGRPTAWTFQMAEGGNIKVFISCAWKGSASCTGNPDVE